MRNFISENVNSLAPSGIRQVMEKALEMERKGEKVYHFEVGRPDFDTPEYIKDACIKSIEEGNVFYTSNFGTDELRIAVSNKLKKENGLNYEKNEILITAGLSEAVFDILLTILGEGDELLVPDPGWINYINVPVLFKANPVPYNLLEKNDFQIDIDELEEKVSEKTKAIVIISPSNPTGGVLAAQTLEKIAEFAKKHDLMVISDEIYERIIYDDAKHLSIGSMPGMKERTITLNGFSKAYSMTGWRLGYIAAPEHFIKAFNKVHQHNTSCATSFVQKAGVVALTEEKEEVNDMVKEYKRRRDYLVEKVNFIEGLSVNSPKGAFYSFINISKLGITCEEFCNRLIDEAKVACVPGTVFGEGGRDFIRMSYANSYENIVKGLEEVEKLVKNILDN
ncbi:Aspartate aminotransferase [Peptoniphilus sp. ING2-D1G]|nr:Aspartate aminotransferase [Peptoniphilus sp. ING2-D1G]